MWLILCTIVDGYFSVKQVASIHFSILHQDSENGGVCLEMTMVDAEEE